MSDQNNLDDVTLTSVWEWKCIYFPDLAETEYMGLLDEDKRIEVLVLKSMQEVFNN